MRTSTRHVYAKSLSESALSTDYPGESLPSELLNLLESDRYALGPDGRAAWPNLGDAQRVSLLERSRIESAKREAAVQARLEREQLCGAYIDALCAVNKVPESERQEARERLDSAREAWFAVRGKKRLGTGATAR